MLPGDDTVRSLREALRFSPDNLPLRRHLADTLVSLGRFEEAVTELKAALAAAPRDEDLLLSLASAYHRAGKPDEATVIVEDLIKMLDGIGNGYRRGRHPDPKMAGKTAAVLRAVADELEL